MQAHQGSRKMEFIRGHNLTFVDFESLTKIENVILADYDFGSEVSTTECFQMIHMYNSYI